MVPEQVLFGLLAFATVTNGWSYDHPQYAARRLRAPVASDMLLQKLRRTKHTSIVLRYSTAASSDNSTPSLLPNEKIETLAALYQNLGGSSLHIKNGWMSASNPCGSGTNNDTWYGVECSTFETGPSKNSTSHVTGLVLPQNSE
jgi:hypothetical protein